MLHAPFQGLRRALFAIPVAFLLMVGADFRPAAAEEASPLDSIVGIRAHIPVDARTAAHLGTERMGSGIVIGKGGLVLTIGYLILEADRVELVLPGAERIPATTVAFDYETGFGLVRSLLPLNLPPIAFGESSGLKVNAPVLVAGYSNPQRFLEAKVVSRRSFAGYWEYLLPDAIFTSPPHPQFGGASLFGPDGKLLGIGSLIVGGAASEDSYEPGNMFVPIDALKPILETLLEQGRSDQRAKPWIGVYSEEYQGHVIVTEVAKGGPADQAGIKPSDIILSVAGAPVKGQADFYRKLWALGDAGTEVPLTLLGKRGMQEVTVTSADRYDWLKLDPSY
ncbi:MAG: serine protease [Alphaproteobacteria bacterium]|nr:serine protease [Alphaproteobacteria bacterium]